MERKTLESAIITHADGREEKEYCPSVNLINKYLDEPSKFVRDMLIKGELCKKLGPLEDIMEKYDFDSPEELNNFLSSMDVEIKKFKANNYLRKVGSEELK